MSTREDELDDKLDWDAKMDALAQEEAREAPDGTCITGGPHNYDADDVCIYCGDEWEER